LKFSLALILCSTITNSCLLPYKYSQNFDSLYTCLVEGYEQSILELKDIGEIDVNKNELYIKFMCTDESKIGEKT
tara:strand:+ start:537 stop:761 length:225 start_codon:yes stop_codon:yes gene_type:complete